MEGNVEISAKRYFELLIAEDELKALRGGGVDNWDGYDDTLEYLSTDENELMEEVNSKLIK